MTQEWLNRIALTIALRNQPKRARTLLDTYDSATTAIQQHPEFVSRAILQRAEQEAAFIEQHSIQTYFYKDDTYPYRLAQCVDAPLILYSKGNVTPNPKHAVSIVGTRRPTENGKDWCRRFILELAQQVPELTIISGLAYGIDVVAHKAAIEAGIPTLIIPAHGLDRIYPALHRNVAVAALQHGGILTEYPHLTEPERYNFVARNRIIAGLADAVVVVESKDKGGSLITAQMAQDYSRDVFALPGRYNDETAAGCNRLIQQNRAQLITCATDLTRAMQWEQETKLPKQTSINELLCNLSDNQQILLQKLRESEDGWHINQLVIEMQLPYNTVASELMMLEIEGMVRSLPGGIWRAL
jgi:DNA processing protein